MGNAGEGAAAATGFDVLLSAQLVAAPAANPLNSVVSLGSVGVATIPGAPSATPVAMIPPSAAMAEQIGQISAANGPAAPVAQPLPVATPATAPLTTLQPAAADLPVVRAVAGKLPETGKPLPAKLPQAPADTAASDDTGEISTDDEPEADGDDRDAQAPALPTQTPSPQTALPVIPSLAVAPAAMPAERRPATPPPSASHVPESAAARIMPSAPASRPRLPENPTAPDLTAAPQTAMPIRTDSLSPAAVRPAPVIAGVAVTIADSPVPTGPQSASLAMPTVPATPPVVATLAPVSSIALATGDGAAGLIPATPFAIMPATAPKPLRTEASVAAPRNYAISISQPASLVSTVAAREDTSAAPGGQGDLGHGQPPMADPSLTSPAGPSPVVSPEATRGPATLPVQQIAPLAAPLPQPVAITPAAHDMGALVDRLVEARAAARTAASPLTVTTAIRHAEFGSVSLRFDTAGDGLSVTMASNDPGFAPAAQAALASQIAPATAADAAGQQNPQRQPAQDQPSAFQPGNTGTGGFAQSQQQPQGQQAQPGFAAATRQPSRPAPTSSGAEQAADPSTHRSGVFA